MNRICLTGNMVKDIKVEYTNNNKNYVRNTIAVRKDKKNEEGNYLSDFIDFVVFEKKADYLNTYAKKGDKIEIEGKLRVDTWKDEEGKTHSRAYVVCDKINILTSRIKEPIIEEPEEENEFKDSSIKTIQQSQIEITDEDLPF